MRDDPSTDLTLLLYETLQGLALDFLELVDRRIEGVVDELEALERERQLRLPLPDDEADATSADMRAF